MSEPQDVGVAIRYALMNGHRHIDCAHYYGNEAEIGKALQKCIEEGMVKREDVFITSKLWYVNCLMRITEEYMYSQCHNVMLTTFRSCDHAPEDVLPACQLTLKNLILDYLDLYLVHAPFRVAKGAGYPPLDKELLLYNSDCMSKCWKVRGITRSFLFFFLCL